MQTDRRPDRREREGEGREGRQADTLDELRLIAVRRRAARCKNDQAMRPTLVVLHLDLT